MKKGLKSFILRTLYREEGILMYIAHYDHQSNRKPHLLREHVKGMLDLICQFDLSFDHYGMTEASIVLHDCAKKSDEFQAYVQNPKGKRGSVHHALGGAYALYQKSHKQIDGLKAFTADLLSLIVASHHRGLFDFEKEFFNKLESQNNRKEFTNIDVLVEEEVKQALSILKSDDLKRIEQTYGFKRTQMYLSILIRFVFSALVDADYLDTATYFNNRFDDVTYNRNFPNFQKLVREKIKTLQKSAENNVLNKLRHRLQQEAFCKGGQEGSFYILRAPTGTGKTLAALEFSLEHARKFGKNRIITALPLINLTEEVSDLYREIFGSEYVTEDHSAVTVSDKNPVKRVVSERWSTPFVVTTTVQLFESLYHNQPSKLRKLHHIYNSVIIIDEFHKLPHHLLTPIMKMLDMLQSEFKVTVLMLSATPYPVLESKVFKQMDLLNKPKKIIEEDNFFIELPDRVQYEYIGDSLELSDVMGKMLEKNSSVLTIVNTRKEAQQLFCLLKESHHTFDNIFHLSTTMCSEHRAEVIEKIKKYRELEPEKKLAVVSTSVLEAGVDLSFPTVFRKVAPLDSIIQAAGRCNRNGENEIGEVILFDLKTTTYKDEVFKSSINFVKDMIKKNGVKSLTEDKYFLSYYKRFLSEVVVDKYELDGREKELETKYLLFEYVANRFRMIEDERLSVICPMASGFDPNWLKERRTRSWWNKIKNFIVPIPKYLANYEKVDDIAIWQGEYDQDMGIKL